MKDRERQPSAVPHAGVGLVLGSGVGATIGLLLAGGDGLALGIVAGAGIGLVIGAAVAALRSRGGPGAGDR